MELLGGATSGMILVPQASCLEWMGGQEKDAEAAESSDRDVQKKRKLPDSRNIIEAGRSLQLLL